MFSGLLIILVPLIVGYLIPLRQQAALKVINQLLSWMVYLILFFMGISLAFLDNLASNLLAILHYSAVSITVILLCNIAALMWLERRDSTRTGTYTTMLRRNREERFTRQFTTDTTHRRLHVHFLTFGEKAQRPSVTVRDLKLTHTLPAAPAVDRLYEQQLNIRIFADEFFRKALPPQDSL